MTLWRQKQITGSRRLIHPYFVSKVNITKCFEPQRNVRNRPSVSSFHCSVKVCVFSAWPNLKYANPLYPPVAPGVHFSRQRHFRKKSLCNSPILCVVVTHSHAPSITRLFPHLIDTTSRPNP